MPSTHAGASKAMRGSGLVFAALLDILSRSAGSSHGAADNVLGCWQLSCARGTIAMPSTLGLSGSVRRLRLQPVQFLLTASNYNA